MSSTTKMAWRSLARNRKRSLVTGSGIALAMAMCMATLGLMDGLSLDLIRGTVDAEVGHVQVHHPAYLETRRVADTQPASDTDLTAAHTPRCWPWVVGSTPGATCPPNAVRRACS